MKNYFSSFKTYFKMNKLNNLTLRIRYQRFLEKFNKDFKFRIKVLSTIFFISKKLKNIIIGVPLFYSASPGSNIVGQKRWKNSLSNFKYDYKFNSEDLFFKF